MSTGGTVYDGPTVSPQGGNEAQSDAQAWLKGDLEHLAVAGSSIQRRKESTSVITNVHAIAMTAVQLDTENRLRALQNVLLSVG
jgi:hypothetical protein